MAIGKEIVPCLEQLLVNDESCTAKDVVTWVFSEEELNEPEAICTEWTLKSQELPHHARPSSITPTRNTRTHDECFEVESGHSEAQAATTSDTLNKAKRSAAEVGFPETRVAFSATEYGEFRAFKHLRGF